jgi:hypothetical protein
MDTEERMVCINKQIIENAGKLVPRRCCRGATAEISPAQGAGKHGLQEFPRPERTLEEIAAFNVSAVLPGRVLI